MFSAMGLIATAIFGALFMGTSFVIRGVLRKQKKEDEWEQLQAKEEMDIFSVQDLKKSQNKKDEQKEKKRAA